MDLFGRGCPSVAASSSSRCAAGACSTSSTSHILLPRSARRLQEQKLFQGRPIAITDQPGRRASAVQCTRHTVKQRRARQVPEAWLQIAFKPVCNGSNSSSLASSRSVVRKASRPGAVPPVHRIAAQAAQSTGGDVDRAAEGLGRENVYIYGNRGQLEEDYQEQEGSEDGSEQEATIGALVNDYVGWCNQEFGLAPFVQVERGNGGLPVVALRHPNGSEAHVYLHGACVTSWTKPNGAQMLHMRPGNPWDGQTPISGGIPVAFPQYRRGPLPADGFLRYQHWSVVDACIGPPEAPDPCPTVVLYAESDNDTREMWPYEFEAFYSISLGLDDSFPDIQVDPNEEAAKARAKRMPEEEEDYEEGVLAPEDDDEDKSAPPHQLTCTLAIRNTDDKPFEFSAALNGHFATAVDLAGPQGQLVRTLGLGGRYCLDWGIDPTGVQPVLRVEDQDYLYFGEDRMDRLYVNAAQDNKGDVLFCPGDRSHMRLLNRKGFRDIGAYHPQGLNAADGTSAFVSLPAARAARPVKLYPGEVWTGELVLRAYDYYWDPPLFDKGMQPMAPRKGTRF